MHLRQLGKTGTDVSAIGFGCASLSGGYGTPDDEKSLQALYAACEHGITFFDTADIYGGGHNEKLLSKFLQRRRAEIVVATKFGIVGGLDKIGLDNSPRHMRAACEASLKRLNVETIDLYFLQRRDPQVPIEETIGAMAQLVQAGKVRWLGLSEVSPNTLYAAHAVHPITAVQSEYSLWTRRVQAGMLDACRNLGVTFVAYCPLGRAFLTGKIRHTHDLEPHDARRLLPRFTSSALEANASLLATIEACAQQRHATPAQIALAWLLCRNPGIVPIPGTRNPQHAIENAKGADIQLTAQEIDALERSIPLSAIVGERYAPQWQVGIEEF